MSENKALGGAGPPADAHAGMDEHAAELAAIWQRHRPEALEQVTVIERALESFGGARPDAELLGEARRAAHMLAGSVGMFGLTRASEAARQLEAELAQPQPRQLSVLLALAATVRDALAGDGDPAPEPPPSEPAIERDCVLVIDRDAEVGRAIAAACSARDLACDVATSTHAARAHIATRRPSVVLLDLSLPPADLPAAYALLSELNAAKPSIPVLVLTTSGSFTDRIEAARRGSRAFLSKSLLPTELLDAVEEILSRDRLAATRILIVDDDQTVLDAMRALLQQHDVEIFTLADPLAFWTTLEEVEPELLILDVGMPGINGPELCRTVRNDPRWSKLAVIFATASTDPATVRLVFEAGADDYIAKPIVGPELVARVSNRLERVRLYRAQAERDGLTGLANRVTSEQGLTQLVGLSARFEEPVSVALLDLDRFKAINDTHGHAAGDRVLQSIAAYLRREFRGHDVAGRWGGEEFVLGMYGMTRSQAALRLARMLEWFGKEEFSGSQGGFQATFSAGVAEYPLDGADTDELCDAADAALYSAKRAGRARIVQAKPRARPDSSPSRST